VRENVFGAERMSSSPRQIKGEKKMVFKELLWEGFHGRPLPHAGKKSTLEGATGDGPFTDLRAPRRGEFQRK